MGAASSNYRMVSFAALQVVLHASLIAGGRASPGVSVTYLAFLLVSYLASKLASPPQRSSKRINELISRPTHWFWLQSFYFSFAVALCALAASVSLLATATVTIQAAFISAKLGCWRVGCCRSEKIYSNVHWLPIAEALGGSLSLITTTHMIAGEHRGDVILYVGIGSLALVRVLSLIAQNRRATYVLRELGVFAATATTVWFLPL